MNNNNPQLTPYAKKLRKNMTKEERKLWYEFFKNLPVNVKRQKVIGKYIVDFYIPTAKTIIELDGGQHYDENGMKSDEKRDNYLKKYGYKILRYSNRDVLSNFDSVCEDILRKAGMWQD